MRWLSDNSVTIIMVVAFVHLVIFVGLWWSQLRQRVRLTSYLRDILGNFRRTEEDPDRPLGEQIDCFLQDVETVLATPHPDAEIRPLCDRLATKDEAKKYLVRNRFETVYNVVRTWIEAYPLMGILGTVLAIGVGLNTPRPEGLAAPEAPASVVQVAPAAETAADQIAASDIVRQFKNAVWSTVWGLIFGLVFLSFNAALEPSFERLIEHRAHVRNAIRMAKEVLFRVSTAGGASS